MCRLPSHSPVHHRPVDICAAFPSHSPFHLCPVDICAAFSSSPPPFHQVNIRHGYHHANLCIGAYKHPHHKSPQSRLGIIVTKMPSENMNLVDELMLNLVLISLVSSKTIIEKKIKVTPIKTGNYLYQDTF
jgi:hypothetical protein